MDRASTTIAYAPFLNSSLFCRLDVKIGDMDVICGPLVDNVDWVPIDLLFGLDVD